MQNVAEIVSAARKLRGNSFAQSVVSQYDRRGSLTDKQISALSSMLNRTEQRVPVKSSPMHKRTPIAGTATTQTATEPTVRPKTDAVDVSRIEALFDAARSNGLKRLKFRAEGLTISPAPAHGSNPGALYVKDVNDEYLGKIAKGVYYPTRFAAETVADTIKAIAADPLAVGVAYGKKTGRCCVCGIELTDPVSIANGIGPICESNWGF